MHLVRYVHWRDEEAPGRARIVAEAGYAVDHTRPSGITGVVPREGREPDVVAIDLSRSPAYGRYIAHDLRRSARTRHIPIIFVDGLPDKVERCRSDFPDAIYVAWEGLPAAIARAIEAPPEVAPPVDRSPAWGHRPLLQKLGIVEGSRVSLLNAPDGFEELLGDLPDGVTIRHGASPRADVTIWFAESGAELEGRIVGYAELAATGRLWIAWPKKSSGVATDLTMQVVHDVALAVDLSSYKVISIDKTWSAAALARRR